MLPSGQFGPIFDPATLSLLHQAFDEAWRALLSANSSLCSTQNAQRTRELLASRIVHAARNGERDSKQLKEKALVGLEP